MDFCFSNQNCCQVINTNDQLLPICSHQIAACDISVMYDDKLFHFDLDYYDFKRADITSLKELFVLH